MVLAHFSVATYKLDSKFSLMLHEISIKAPMMGIKSSGGREWKHIWEACPPTSAPRLFGDRFPKPQQDFECFLIHPIRGSVPWIEDVEVPFPTAQSQAKDEGGGHGERHASSLGCRSGNQAYASGPGKP